MLRVEYINHECISTLLNGGEIPIRLRARTMAFATLRMVICENDN
jgi:hypothetical protein